MQRVARRIEPTAAMFLGLLGGLLIAWAVLRFDAIPIRTFDYTVVPRGTIHPRAPLPLDSSLRRYIRRAEIDHMLRPTDATRWPHLLHFHSASRGADGDIYFVFEPGYADVFVIYRFDPAHDRFVWKMPYYTEA